METAWMLNKNKYHFATKQTEMKRSCELILADRQQIRFHLWRTINGILL